MSINIEREILYSQRFMWFFIHSHMWKLYVVYVIIYTGILWLNPSKAFNEKVLTLSLKQAISLIRSMLKEKDLSFLDREVHSDSGKEASKQVHPISSIF